MPRAVLADSVGLAMLVVLDTLAPAERVAFVLHDMFGLPFGEIGSATGRSAAAARQLASRARRRVRGTTAVSGTRLARQREVPDDRITRIEVIADPDRLGQLDLAVLA